MAKRDRELRHRLEELFSSEAEALPVDSGPIDPAGSTADTLPVEASPIDPVARALEALPPALWKTILDHLPLPVYLKDREHTWIAVNGAWGDLLGRPAGMLIGHVDKEQSDEAWQLDDQVLEGGQADDSQTASTALDGSVLTRRTRRVPLTDEHGQVRYVLGIIEDSVKPAATEQTASTAPVDNAALARFQAIVEATPIPILITRVTDGRPLYVNARASTMFGVPREDMLNHTTLEFYDAPADRQKILAVLQRDGRVVNYELRLKRGDGSLLWVMLDVQPLVYNNERAVLSGFYDITARKQAEAQLQTSETLYQSLVDTIPENLCRKDKHGRFTYGNRHYCELVGLSLEELIGKTDFDIHPPDLAEKYRADDQAVMASGKPAEFLEAHEVLGTGEQSFVRTIKSPLYDAQGQLLGIQIMFWDATELGRAEQALKLRTSALEAAANGIAITNRDGEMIWVNPAFTHLTGYTFEEAVGQNARILNSGRQSKEFYRAMWQTILSGQNWHGELVNRRKDGREYDEEITITPVRASGGEITHFIAIMQDIRERKRGEEQMLRFKLGMERSGDAIFITDLDGTIEYVNPAFEKTYGYLAAEAIGQNPRILKSGVIPQERYAHFWQTLKARGTVAGEIINKTKDGRLITIEGANTPIIDSADNLVGFLAVHRDITARKQTERRLAEAAQRLQVLIENAPDMIYIKDQQGRFLVANQPVAALAGAPSVEALIGKTDLDFFPREFAEKYRADEQAIVRSGQPLLNMEEMSAGPDGEPRWLSTTKVPFRNADGQIEGIVGIGRDITERKQIEAERERLLTVEARRAVQLQAGSEIANAAATILEPDKLLPVVVELVRERYDLYYAGLFLVDASGRWAELRSGTGEAGRKMLDARHRLEVGGTSMVGRCVTTGEPRIALDVGAEAIRFDNPLLPRTRSEMALPLTSRGQIIGALTIQSTQLAAFTDDDINALRVMSSQIATAIENARLFQETQRRAEEQAVLFDLAQSLSTQLAVDQVLQQIYQGASRLIDTANFYIGLYDPARHEVDFVINASESVVDKSITTISADQGMTGYIIRTRSSVLIREDIDSWLKANGLQRVGSAAQSWLGVPLMLGDQVLGVMSVQNYTTPNVYDEHDRDVLYLLGAQAAIAIQNARLFEQTHDARATAESRLRETQVLQEFSQAVSQALDVPQVLDALVTTLQSRLEFSHIAIALIEPEAAQLTIVRGVGSAANLQGLARPLAAVQDDITLHIMHGGQIEVIDGWDDRLDREIFEREGHADLVRAFVPVRLRDEAIGLIEAGYQRAARAQITPEELRVLGGLADQVAIAIDNARLLEQVQTALGEAEQLYNASQQLSTAPDVPGMLTALVQHVSVPDVNRVIVWLYEFDAERQVTAIVTGAAWHSGIGEPPPPIGTRLPPAAMHAFQFAQSRQPVITNDAEHDDRLNPGSRAVLRQLHVRAAAILPLWASDRQVGMLMLQSEQPHTFVDTEVRPYMSLTQQMATAIENRRLFEQTQHDAEREHSLNRIATAISRSATVSELLPTALDVTLETIGFECGLATLFDTATNTLRILAQRDLPEPLSKRLATGLSGTLCEYVFIQGQATFLEDLRQDAPVDVGGLLAQGLQSYVGIPLTYQDHTLGTLCMFGHTIKPLPDNIDVLLRSIGQQIGVGVENARLFEQTQRDAERERTINRITSRLRNAQSVEQVLNIATQELRAATRSAVTVAEIAPAVNRPDDHAPNGHSQTGQE
ncbi:MAG: PAS domain S-box protein [Chloroflexi bacterium]|nr:PAS domain S-box protein [Chloroflexota bacterium]